MTNVDQIAKKWDLNTGEIAARIAAKRSAFDVEGFTRSLKSKIYGQDPIVDAIARQVRTRLTRQAKRKKPMCIMFAGPSSVGKTESAKLLADALGYKLYIEACNLLSEEHKVSAITGSVLGYQGHGTDTAIIQALKNADNKLVILLDEFEKCHANVANVFLSVFDDGKLQTSSSAHDFSQCIFIATSNAGISGFDFDGDEPGTPASFERIRRAMKGAFLPEVLNRFSSIFMFRPLNDGARHRLIAEQVEMIVNELHRLDADRSRDGMAELVVSILAGFKDTTPNGRTLAYAVENHVVPQLDEVAAGTTVYIAPDGAIRPC